MYSSVLFHEFQLTVNICTHIRKHCCHLGVLCVSSHCQRDLCRWHLGLPHGCPCHHTQISSHDCWLCGRGGYETVSVRYLRKQRPSECLMMSVSEGSVVRDTSLMTLPLLPLLPSFLSFPLFGRGSPILFLSSVGAPGHTTVTDEQQEIVSEAHIQYMSLGFSFWYKKPVMPKKKVFVARNLPNLPLKAKRKSNFFLTTILCFP